MDNQQERLFNLGWLIGLLDGEGSFGLHSVRRVGKNDYYAPNIQVGNTKPLIVIKVTEVLRSLDIPFYVSRKKLKSGKTYANVRVVGFKRVKKFFDVIGLERFECRNDQAKLVRDYVELRLSKPYNDSLTDKEHELAHLLRKLNT